MLLIVAASFIAFWLALGSCWLFVLRAERATGDGRAD
jgi:hypothetical protein